MNTERQARQEQIDRQLGRAGWAFGSRRLITEFLVPMPSEIREPGAGERRTVEFADYALLDRLGRPLAIVEAKRSSRDPLERERQAADYAEAYDYYPEKWVSPYIDRRRENGWSLYGLLGIGKGDKDKMHLQHQRNYRFFDAPVGLMFTIDRVMGRGSLLDYGMFIQSVMVAARSRGLGTCPQAAWNGFASIILPHIEAGGNEMLVCGMALGYADPTDVVNTFHTPRVAVDEFTHWLD